MFIEPNSLTKIEIIFYVLPVCSFINECLSKTL